MCFVPQALPVLVLYATSSMGGSRGGGQGIWPPSLKNHKNIGFLSNTGPDTLKNHKASLPSQHSMLGNHRSVSETPFKWRFAGGPMMSHFKWHFDPLSIASKKKTLSVLDPLGRNLLDPRMVIACVYHVCDVKCTNKRYIC